MLNTIFTNESNAAKKMYYRIAARDAQAAIKYSNIVMLRSNSKEQLISVFPNPIIDNKINIKLFETPNTTC